MSVSGAAVGSANRSAAERRPFHHRFAADVAQLALVRILVRHWLVEGGYDDAAATDVLVVANELSIHAIGGMPRGWCELRLEEAGGSIIVDVAGHAAPAAAGRTARHLGSGSPARVILDRLVDDLHVTGTAARCSVHAARDVRAR